MLVEIHLFLSFFCALIFLLMFLEFSVASNIITRGQSISDGEVLVSSGQSFRLGFLSLGNSKNRYLGIWNKNTPRVLVWIANQNNPITDPYGVLTFTNDGALVLLHHTNVIWSSTLSKAAENPVAQLLENGDLVLWDNISTRPRDYLWRSSEDLINILLPGTMAG